VSDLNQVSLVNLKVVTGFAAAVAAVAAAAVAAAAAAVCPNVSAAFRKPSQGCEGGEGLPRPGMPGPPCQGSACIH
jgi:hypothetical protein